MAKSLHANDHVIVGDCAVVAPVFALFVRRCWRTPPSTKPELRQYCRQLGDSSAFAV